MTVLASGAPLQRRRRPGVRTPRRAVGQPSGCERLLPFRVGPVDDVGVRTGIRNPSDPDAPGAGDAPQVLGDVLDFMRLLWAVDHNLQLTSKRMVNAIGLTGPQRMVIRLVGRFPNISAGSLAQTLHLHPSTLTGVLKRLEGRGLIWRKTDPADGRRALFGLTQKGTELDLPTDGTVESAVSTALAKLDKPTIDAAAVALTRIATELAEQLEPKKGLELPRSQG